MEQPSDKLIDRIRNGDEAAFSELMDCYSARIMRVCLGQTGNWQDAEDCAQETWIKVFRFLHSYRDSASVYTWIYRICINTCRDYQRSARRHQAVSLDESDDEIGSTLGERIVDPMPLPDEQADRRQQIERVRRGIAALPPDARNILVLRDIAGLSYQEIAANLRLAEGTVKSRLSRARASLMDLLREQESIKPRLKRESKTRRSKGRQK